MSRNGILLAALAAVAVCQSAQAIDYKKNTISGGGITNTSRSFIRVSTMTSINGSNRTEVSVNRAMPTMSSMSAGDFDWPEHGFGRKTIDQKIRDTEQRLNKLYFTRDVCRKLEDEIRISFEKKDIREVLAQVDGVLGTKLPYEVPEGKFLVEKSEVSGMPVDQFLESIAQVCGLQLRYERDRLVFTKPEAGKWPR